MSCGMIFKWNDFPVTVFDGIFFGGMICPATITVLHKTRCLLFVRTLALKVAWTKVRVSLMPAKQEAGSIGRASRTACIDANQRL